MTLVCGCRFLKSTGSYCDAGGPRSLVAPRWTSREHVTVFRAPCGTLLVMGSYLMVQLPPGPFVFGCTSMRPGLRTISSLSVYGGMRRWFLRSWQRMVQVQGPRAHEVLGWVSLVPGWVQTVQHCLGFSGALDGQQLLVVEGSGVVGTPGLRLPAVLSPFVSCMLVVAYRPRHVIDISSAPPPPPDTPPRIPSHPHPTSHHSHPPSKGYCCASWALPHWEICLGWYLPERD